MRCDQCNAVQITMGNSSAYCHEHGCPNTHKVYDEEEGCLVNPEPDPEDEYESEYGDFGDYPDYDDLGPTGHGDICHSDADSGL